MLRIRNVIGAFDTGLIPNWSEQLFLVKSDRSIQRRVFKLIDKVHEELKDSCFPEEVQKITKNRFLIEKGIRKRTTDKA